MPKPTRWKRALPETRELPHGAYIPREMIGLPHHGFSALTTDLYEVTMAHGYFKAEVIDHEAVFHVTFRENPFSGQFTEIGRAHV